MHRFAIKRYWITGSLRIGCICFLARLLIFLYCCMRQGLEWIRNMRSTFGRSSASAESAGPATARYKRERERERERKREREQELYCELLDNGAVAFEDLCCIRHFLVPCALTLGDLRWSQKSLMLDHVSFPCACAHLCVRLGVPWTGYGWSWRGANQSRPQPAQ